MSSVNEFSAIVLFLLLGFWIIHIFQGNGTKWVFSFFSGPGSSNNVSGGTLPGTITVTQGVQQPVVGATPTHPQ